MACRLRTTCFRCSRATAQRERVTTGVRTNKRSACLEHCGACHRARFIRLQASAPWRTPIRFRLYALVEPIDRSTTMVAQERVDEDSGLNGGEKKTETTVKLMLSLRLRTHYRLVGLVQFSTQVQSTPTAKLTKYRLSLDLGSYPR